MNYQLGLVQSDDRITIKNLSDSSSMSYPLAEISELRPTVLFYPKERILPETINHLMAQSAFFPVRPLENLNWEEIEQEEAIKIIGQVSSSWTLHNNLTLLEELAAVSSHLKDLWPNDRTTFFEEIWHIVVKNLNAQSVKLYFNDLDKQDPKKLARVEISGTRVPWPSEGAELAEKMMNHFEEYFHSPFQVAEYDYSNGQIAIAGHINKSPYVIMGLVPELNRLQKGLLKSLFDLLQTS